MSQGRGIIALGIVILVSSFLLLLLILLAFLGIQMGTAPPNAKLGLLFLIAIMAIAVLAGIGLLLRRVWARYLSIGAGFLLTCFFLLCSAIQVLNPGRAHRSAVFSIFIFATLICLTTATYLSRKKVGELFEDPERLARRPTAVMFVACAMIGYALFIPFILKTSSPAVLFGITLAGTKRDGLLLFACGLFAVTGCALFFRFRGAFWVAVGLQVCGFVSGLINVALRNSFSYSRLSYQGNGQGVGQLLRTLMPVNVLLIFVIPLALLFIGQAQFFRSTTKQKVEPSELSYATEKSAGAGL